MTGYGQPEDRQRSKEAGFQHHLVKPVDPVSLQHLLTEFARSGPGGPTWFCRRSGRETLLMLVPPLARLGESPPRNR